MPAQNHNPCGTPWYSYGPIDPVDTSQILKNPPGLFPFAVELENKLAGCMTSGVISRCIHTKTNNETYVLSIDIPFGENNITKDQQINMFIRAMKEKYKLDLIKRQKDISTVSSYKQHILVFEYDPQKHRIKP